MNNLLAIEERLKQRQKSATESARRGFSGSSIVDSENNPKSPPPATKLDYSGRSSIGKTRSSAVAAVKRGK